MRNKPHCMPEQRQHPDTPAARHMLHMPVSHNHPPQTSSGRPHPSLTPHPLPPTQQLLLLEAVHHAHITHAASSCHPTNKTSCQLQGTHYCYVLASCAVVLHCIALHFRASSALDAAHNAVASLQCMHAAFPVP
jgi:hypothetical protein